MTNRKRTYAIKLQIMSGDDLAMGPGKADLLDQIQQTGSIAAAGRAMEMSYKRAWDLVEVMNGCFNGPLVIKSKGGASKGGATVTPLGIEILNRYRSLQSKASSKINNEIDGFFDLMIPETSDK